MGLPAGGFNQFLDCCSIGPLQQIQDLSCFASVACGSGHLGPFGRFLLGGALLGRLGLGWRNVRALWRDTGLRAGLRLLGIRLGGADFFVLAGHVHSWAVITAITLIAQV